MNRLITAVVLSSVLRSMLSTHYRSDDNHRILKDPLFLFRDPIHEIREFFFPFLIFRRVIDNMHDDIYNSAGRLEQRKQTLAAFKNGRCAIEFLDKMILMGLSPIRVASIAFHVISILRIKDDTELRYWTKEDTETIVREFQKKGN